MDTRNKTSHDPVADLYMLDLSLGWALQAAEEVVGERGLNVVLRQVGLERFIKNYPGETERATGQVNFGDYAKLNAGLLEFFGRAGKSMVLRIGRLSTRKAMQMGGGAFQLAIAATRLLPLAAQMKMVLERQQSVFRKFSAEVGQEQRLRIEEREDAFVYIAEDCWACAGIESHGPICLLVNGALHEGLTFVTHKEFDIREIECRAAGAPACVWEISKKPKE